MQSSDYQIKDIKKGKVQRLASLFLILVVIAFVSLGAWQIFDSYTKRYQEFEKDNANLARAISQHAEDTFRDIDAISATDLDRIESEGIANMQLDRLHALFQKQVTAIPSLSGLLVYDKDGNWLINDKNMAPIGANNSDREYFQYHKANPQDRGLHIGHVIKSRSTGSLVIPVSRRINNPDGSFAGVFLATFRLDYFVSFYNSFTLDDQSVILLTLRDGTILARSPFKDDAIGASLGEGKIYREYLPKAPAGTVMVPSILDRVDKLFSYQTITPYPLVALVGVTGSTILGPWYIESAKTAGLVGFVVLLILIMGFALLKRIELGLRAEEELKLAHAEVNKLAMLDSLTGLSNRRQLDMTLPLEIMRARRSGQPLGIIMIDIDNFKSFNDLYGHVAGDECLRRVADLLKSRINRSSDLVVRYGGEEFTVLLPGSDDIATYQVAESILCGVRELAEPHAGSDAGVITISAGVYVYIASDSNNDITDQRVLNAADESLYAAKQRGRNRIFPPLCVLT